MSENELTDIIVPDTTDAEKDFEAHMGDILPLERSEVVRPPIFEFSEIQVTKLNLRPGDKLAVTIKSDEMDEEMMRHVKDNLERIFKGNQVLVFGIGSNDSILFTQVGSEPKAESSCSTGSYCVDCSCGKKEQYEGK